MACNAWNHSSHCNCGWGGVSYGQPTANDIQPALKTSFTNPNATCPACGASVYFYRSESGGSAWFDSLGWPWPKHPCMDLGHVGSGRAAAPSGAPVSLKADDSPVADWVPFEIISVVRPEGRTLIVGRPDQHVATVGVGVMIEINTACGLPAFIRAKPERRGAIDFTTLHDLEPVMVDAYLDCTELDELLAWEAALEGSPPDQNAIGWRLCFGRARTHPFSTGEFTRANWSGGLHWLCLAASGGHPSALNNLASKRMMEECGIEKSKQNGMRDRLYACAASLDRNRTADMSQFAAALADTKKLVGEYQTLVAKDCP